MRTEKEKHEMIDRANAAIEEGGIYPGMTYEDGIKAALEWEMGITDEEPMEKEK